MSLTAWYGSFRHDTNNVGINGWNVEYVDGETTFHKLKRITVDIKPKIIRQNQIQIFAALSAMQTAYSVDGQSFTIFDDFGNIIWTLDNTSSLGGVRVLKPVTFGSVMGSEGTTYLNCQVVLQADYLCSLQANQYLTFKETVTFRGRGQALKVKRQPARGYGFKQPVTERSFYYAIQTGSLSTTTPFPNPMDPLWPALFDGTEDDAELPIQNPQTVKGSPTEWYRAWTYHYSDCNPITGFPNIY